jgi:hypothetical protein
MNQLARMNPALGPGVSDYVQSDRKRAVTGRKLANARVLRALDSMTALAEFARDYHRGTKIPRDVWVHAKIMGEYLGYPPAKDWLPQFLNRPAQHGRTGTGR